MPVMGLSQHASMEHMANWTFCINLFSRLFRRVQLRRSQFLNTVTATDWRPTTHPSSWLTEI